MTGPRGTSPERERTAATPEPTRPRNRTAVALLALLATLPPGAALASPTTVLAVAHGEAPLQRANIAVVRTLAITDAKRNAILWAAGTTIDIENLPHDERVQIVADSEVTAHRVVAEGVEGQLYRVILEAEVLLPPDVPAAPHVPIDVTSAYPTLRQEFHGVAIDWTNGVTEAEGRARIGPTGPGDPAVRRAAVADATGRLVEATKAIPATRRERIGDNREPLFAYRLQAILRQAEIVAGSERIDGDFLRLRIRLPLWGPGGLGTLYYREVLRKLPPPASPRPTAAAELPIPTPAEPLPTRADATTNSTPGADTPHTGIVIDASRTDLRVSLFPSLIDPEGRSVSGPHSVEDDFLRRVGMASFVLARSEPSASFRGLAHRLLRFLEVPLAAFIASAAAAAEPESTFRRDGDHPLVIEALGADGPLATDLILSKAVAVRLATQPDLSRLLRTCRVTIIVPPSMATTATAPIGPTTGTGS